MAKTGIWTMAFAHLFGLRFVSTMVYFVLNTTLAAIVYSLYSATAWQAGVVIGAYMLGMVIGRLLLTRYVDVLGRKKTMLIASFLSIVFMLGYFVQVSMGFFVGFRFLHGMVQGLFSNVITTVGVALVMGGGHHGEGVATYSLSVSLATAIGPFIGSFMLSRFSYQGVFCVAIAIMVVVFVATLFMNINEVEIDDDQRKRLLKGRGVGNYLYLPAVPLSLIVGFTANAGYIVITAFLNSYAAERGLEDFAALYFAAYAGFLLVFRPLSGSLMDRFGDGKVMIPSFVSNVLGLCLLACAQNVWLLLLASCLNALGQGCTWTGGQAMVTRGVEPLRLGVAMSTYYVISDIGYTLGPVLFGLLVPLVGYSGMYMADAAMILASCMAYAVFVKRSAR